MKRVLFVVVIALLTLTSCASLSTRGEEIGGKGLMLPVFDSTVVPEIKSIDVSGGDVIQISTWVQDSKDYGFHFYVSYIDLPENNDLDKPRMMIQGLILDGYYDEFLAAMENIGEGQFIYRGGNAGVMYFLDSYASGKEIDLVRAELALFGPLGIRDNLHFKRSCFFEWGDDIVYMMMLYYPEYMRDANRIEKELLEQLGPSIIDYRIWDDYPV